MIGTFVVTAVMQENKSEDYEYFFDFFKFFY